MLTRKVGPLIFLVISLLISNLTIFLCYQQYWIAFMDNWRNWTQPNYNKSVIIPAIDTSGTSSSLSATGTIVNHFTEWLDHKNRDAHNKLYIYRLGGICMFSISIFLKYGRKNHAVIKHEIFSQRSVPKVPCYDLLLWDLAKIFTWWNIVVFSQSYHKYSKCMLRIFSSAVKTTPLSNNVALRLFQLQIAE